MKNTNLSFYEDSSTKKRILISSLYPLGGNYGGLLQAYALQRVITDMGFEVTTIDSSRRYSALRYALRRIRYTVRRAKRDKTTAYPANESQTAALQEKPLNFISRYINTIDYHGLPKGKRRQCLENTSAIVVGSDQVWRGGYADVLDQFLQDAEGCSLTKVSYAASFGADRLIRFSPRVKRRASELAKQFSAISVREESGIKICRDEFGVDATQHVDPTLLLGRADYEAIIRASTEPSDEHLGGVFAYVLDRSPEVEALIEKVAENHASGVNDFYLDLPTVKSDLTQRLDSFCMKPVEAWLTGIANADFVVTDSFHGTVFSIIFNKPFLSIANDGRGRARFESLLKLFGLESRLVNAIDVAEISDLAVPDWDSVEEKISAERERSIRYLHEYLIDESASSEA